MSPTLAAIFLIALALSYLLTPVAGRLGFAIGVVDQPRGGEVQRRVIPRTGGYAIYVALLLAVALSLLILPRYPDEYPRIAGFVLGALVLLPLAIVDDLRRLGPLPQFAGQLIAASVAIAFGIKLDSIANPFGGLVAIPDLIAIPLTLAWYIGMVNTLNFLDTMDGLAAGVSGIAAAVLFARALGLDQISVAALMLALAGAALGFLPHNLNPARIFMGSSGSMLLGYSLATLAILGGAKLATTSMVLAVPIVDTALVVAQRVLAGRSPFRGGDGAHLPHRLLKAGLHQRAIAFLLYALCLILGYLGLTMKAVEKLYAFGVMAVVVAAAVLVIAYRSRPVDTSSPSRGRYRG